MTPLPRLLATLLFLAVPLGAGDAPRVTALRAPHGGFQPCAAVDAQGTIHLVVYTGEAKRGQLLYLRSTDGGRTFGQPMPITTDGTPACAYGAVRGAQLALGRNGRVHVAWNGPAEDGGTAAPMLYTRLDDAGIGFEQARDVIGEHHGLDGGGALVADSDGRVWVVWHAPETAGGDEAARRVFVARSDDDGRTFGPEGAISPVDSGVCPCCGMAAFASGEELNVVFRTAKDREKRDSLLIRSGPGTVGYQRLDRWMVPTCVMSTYSVASSASGTLVAFESQGAVRFARAGSPGVPASTTAPGDSAARKHPSIACNSRGEVLLAWIAGPTASQGGVLEWQLFDSKESPIAAGDGGTGSRDDVPVWDVPSAVALADGNFALFY